MQKAMSNKAFVSNEDRERRLNALAARLGLSLKTEAKLPTATKTTIRVLVDTDAARLARAHYGADAKIAVDQGYDAMCSRTDAMLAEIIKAGIPALPRTKSTRRARVPHVMTND